MHHVVLAGFANAGKTSLFNLIASSDSRVGNWSGVTVDAKSKVIKAFEQSFKLTDLPGLSSLSSKAVQGKDITLTQQYLRQNPVDLIVNVIDVNQLQRELILTMQLLKLNRPMMVLLNKSDSKAGLEVDVLKLKQLLGCEVIEVSTKKTALGKELGQVIVNRLEQSPHQEVVDDSLMICSEQHLMQYSSKAKEIVDKTVDFSRRKNPWSERVDNFALNPILGFPIFLGMMYLLFMFAINVGSSFIDFFDILVGHWLVAYPQHLLADSGLPVWLLTLIEGIGSGIQTVATFIPVVASLFIGLTILEASGYLARAAFVVEGVMNKIGLPGKAFVPLIVGFGCTVPAVMASRVMDSESARIKTVMMAPFMSCGARLPVYALFAAAFFPDNGQDLVFLLYLIGIAAAIFTGLMLKLTLLGHSSAHTLMELPKYQLPGLAYLLRRVYGRTKSFVTGAGKTIVIVVCLLNFINSVGTDGSFGNQDSDGSVLSEGAKVVTPLLAPMGIQEDNWQAGVGIITGIFAKEVLVATFNSLYSPNNAEGQALPSAVEVWQEAVGSIGSNLLDIKPEDPLGVDVGEVDSLEKAAVEQDVELSTYHNMQKAFDGQLGAFSYLIFILLYTPCVAAMGAIKNEVGTRWASFAAVWSFGLAYGSATLCYQFGMLSATPLLSSIIIAIVLLGFFAVYRWLKHKANTKQSIDATVTYS